MSTKVNKTISIDKNLNSITKEMPNFSGFVQYCLVSYSQGNLEIDWNEIDVQSKSKVFLNKSGDPNKKIITMVGGPREERGRYAGFIPRSCALLIDLILISIPSILLSLVGISSGIAFLIVGLVYPVLFNASSWQATPGKRLFGLVVTDLNGNKLSLKKALKRHAWIFLIVISFGFGYLGQLMTDHKQTNQDLMARTLVVKKGMDNWAQ